MKKTMITTIALLSFMAGTAAVAGAQATRVSEAIWAHGELYDTVVTPATFVAPPEHSTDTIYSFMANSLTGQRSVADSAPGDRHFNGGRWDVQMAVYTQAGQDYFDPDGDGQVNFEVMNLQELLDLEADGYINIYPANFYFECPMLPRKN